jgi:undecaprenyl-diphosphatase
MDIALQALFIGIVQGLTEFLPISSSAHLIAVPRLLGWNDPFLNSATFDVMLHAGTLVALVIYFWRDLWKLFRAWVRSIVIRRIDSDPDSRLAWLVFITMIPAAALGAGLESFFDSYFRERLFLVAVLLVIGAALLWLAERQHRGERDLAQLRVPDAVAIGAAQAFALFPGISRSGITIASGLFLGLRRDAAARFSFLMGTPVIAGAAAWKARELIGATGEATPAGPLALGVIGAAVAGLAAIGFLLSYLRRSDTGIFSLERVILAGAIVAFVLSR